MSWTYVGTHIYVTLFQGQLETIPSHSLLTSHNLLLDRHVRTIPLQAFRRGICEPDCIPVRKDSFNVSRVDPYARVHFIEEKRSCHHHVYRRDRRRIQPHGICTFSQVLETIYE